MLSLKAMMARCRLTLFLCALCAGVIATACGSPPPLAHASPSAEGLAVAVLQALEARDADALERLALSEGEFREHVWPSLPAARPERNLPFGYVWGDLHQKSRQGLAALLAGHGGAHYRFVRLCALEGTTQYDQFVVHRAMEVTVEDGVGNQIPLRLFGSMLEKDGTYKVFSFVIND